MYSGSQRRAHQSRVGMASDVFGSELIGASDGHFVPEVGCELSAELPHDAHERAEDVDVRRM